MISRRVISVSIKWKPLLLICICLLLASAFPAFFIFSQNADSVSWQETMLPTAHMLLIAFGVLICAGVIMRSVYKGALWALMFMLAFENFTYIESGLRAIFLVLRYWHVLIIFISLMLFLFLLIKKLCTVDIAKVIVQVVTVTLSFLILINAAMTVPVLLRKVKSVSETKAQSADEMEAAETAQILPNIYLFNFDEYSAFDVIEKYYQYDNSGFARFLESKKFNISYSSTNPLSISSPDTIPSTTSIWANLLNLDYISSIKDSADVLQHLRNNGTMYPLLREHGYIVVGMCIDNEFVGLSDEGTQRASTAVTLSGDTLYDLLMKNTALYPFIQLSHNETAQEILNWFQSFSEPSNFRASNQFTMARINFPHVPYLFDANGNRVRETELNNWDDKQYYRGQYIFATKCIETMMNQIIIRDPNSVIILQSDHSMRFVDFRIPRTDQAKILNAVYFRGESLDIEGLSGLNTILTVLNRVLGLNMALKEDYIP